MGFHEDDRIRSKNLLNNAAYDHYVQLRTIYQTNEDIAAYCQEQIKSSNDVARNEIYSMVLKIVGGKGENKTT